MTDTTQGYPTETASIESVAPTSTVEATPAATWRDSLPDILKSDRTIQKYDSQEKALEALIHSNKLLGKRVQEIPSDELRNFISPEELYEIAHTRGLPKSVEEYKSEKLDGKLPPEMEKELKTRALEYGLTPERLEGIVEYQNEMSKRLQDAQRETWRADTFNRFGSETEKMADYGVRAIKEFGGEEAPLIVETLRQTGLGDNPVVINFLAKIGKAMSEDTIPHPTSTARSDESHKISTEIKSLLNNKTFMTAWNSRDSKAQAHLDGLYKKQIELEGR